MDTWTRKLKKMGLLHNTGYSSVWLLRITAIWMGFHLTGCAFLPFSKPDSANDEMINNLLYNTPKPPSNAADKNPVQSRSEKQISMNLRRYPAEASPPVTLVSVRRCLANLGMPNEIVQAANPTNYDIRQALDAEGRTVAHSPKMVVLHETVISEQESIQMFQTPHTDDDNQASYHVLVTEDGRLVRIVSDDKRAFGAGNSAFNNYTIRLKPDSPGSINNVALHLSLVSPPDGRGETLTHSGYTVPQYRSTAAQVLFWQASYGIPLGLLTTHKDVDLSKSRKDPRSFDWSAFLSIHQQLATTCGLQAYTSR
ncbi:MAG: peptidoglycan recognition family protein [Cyanobacteriota bacterium]|jgi:N-acetyl-anhydromuramyl-L-alanine amidase AmpD